jgi:hypothetical protein
MASWSCCFSVHTSRDLASFQRRSLIEAESVELRSFNINLCSSSNYSSRLERIASSKKPLRFRRLHVVPGRTFVRTIATASCWIRLIVHGLRYIPTKDRQLRSRTYLSNSAFLFRSDTSPQVQSLLKDVVQGTSMQAIMS